MKTRVDCFLPLEIVEIRRLAMRYTPLAVFGTISKFIDPLHLYPVSAGLKEEDTNDGDESDSVRFNNEAMRKSVASVFQYPVAREGDSLNFMKEREADLE